MKLVIEIDCEHSHQINSKQKGLGDILRKVAEKMDDYGRNQPVQGRILDEHCLVVGSYKRA